MTFKEAIDFIDKENYNNDFMLDVVTVDKMKELIKIIYGE